MNKKIKIAFALLFLLIVFSGAKCSGNSNTEPGNTDSLEIGVYKSDRSVQCEKYNISLEIMAQELINNDIKILSSKKDNNGLIHIALCGTGTGNINVYKIRKEDLEKALSLSFKVFGDFDA